MLNPSDKEEGNANPLLLKPHVERVFNGYALHSLLSPESNLGGRSCPIKVLNSECKTRLSKQEYAKPTDLSQTHYPIHLVGYNFQSNALKRA